MRDEKESVSIREIDLASGSVPKSSQHVTAWAGYAGTIFWARK
jgi:hypothetical protein